MPQDDTRQPSHSELHPDIGEARHRLHMQVRQAVRTLQMHAFSYREIGMVMGYPEGGGAKQRASDVINESWTPPTWRVKLLSKAASRRGFDGISDDFSSAEKRAQALPGQAGSQRDACISDEVRRARDAVACASMSDRAAELPEARRHALTAHLWTGELVREIEHKMQQAGLQWAPLPLAAGDGLPSATPHLTTR